MDKQALAYLADRLEAVAKGPFCEAAILVRKVMASTSPALEKPEAEHALFQAVWDYISQALDHEEYELANEQAVFALEYEMAGRVYSYRTQRGWLRRSDECPPDYPRIENFLGALS